MSESKTQATAGDVDAFVGGLTDPRQRDDVRALTALMARVSSEEPKLWGPSIIGFGSYDYRYDSGRTGTSMRIGFAPRTGKLVIYGLDSQLGVLAELGKYTTGKGCLNIKRLSDVDLTVLEQRIGAAWAAQ